MNLTSAKLLEVLYVESHLVLRWLGLDTRLIEVRVLPLPNRLLVVTKESDRRERVANELCFDLLVKDTAAAQRRQAVDFEDPRLERLVKHNIEAVYLKAAALSVPGFVHLVYNRVFDRNESLNDHISAVLEQIGELQAALTCLLHRWDDFFVQVFFKLLQRPLGRVLFFWVLIILLVPRPFLVIAHVSFDIALVDAKIGQMHILVSQMFGIIRIFLCGKSGKTLVV